MNCLATRPIKACHRRPPAVTCLSRLFGRFPRCCCRPSLFFPANVDQSRVSAILVAASCPLSHSDGISPLKPHELSLHDPSVILSYPSFAPFAAYAVSLAPGCSISRRHLQLGRRVIIFLPLSSPPCCVVFPQCSPFPVESPQSCSNVLSLTLGLRLQMPAIFILVPNVPLCANRSSRPIKPYGLTTVRDKSRSMAGTISETPSIRRCAIWSSLF
ncbi:hypothetical protein HDV63DRAFT_248526 [Trichoderma sp. SZMC 28014]